jgi:hypothetical protein
VVSQRKLRTSLADGRPLSSCLVPSAGNPLGNTVSEREADDQSNCNFQHWGRATFQEARQWLRGSKERVKVTCERELPMLPREWVRRLKRDVALSPLVAFGGKSIREHRIQARCQRSERLQFQASGVIGQRFPAVTVPASNAELRSRHHGLARMRARGPVRAISGASGRMTATSDSLQRADCRQAGRHGALGSSGGTVAHSA